MAGRHADLQIAMVSGQVPEVARIPFDDQNGTRVGPVSRADDHSFAGGEHSEVMLPTADCLS